MKVTKNTKLSELLENPEAVEILAKNNLPCLTCPFVQYEMDKLKIGDICKIYKIKTENLLKDLNRVYAKDKKK